MKRGLIITACITSLLFGGCKYAMEDIMAKPKSSIINKNIHSLIEKNIPQNFKLLEDSINSINMLDLNNDNENELIVFYQNKDEELNKVLKIAVYNIINNKLKLIDEINNNGKELSTVQFEDINADGVIEIITKMKEDNPSIANNYTLNIYKYNKSLHELASIPLEQYKLVDMNEDNKLEILTAFKEDMLFTNVRLYQYKEDGYSMVSEEMLGDAEVRDLVTGNVAKDVKGVYVQSILGANTSINHLLVYQDDKLTNPIKLNFSNTRDKGAFELNHIMNTGKALDINKDGILEIPMYYNLTNSIEDRKMGIKWFRWDKENNIELVAKGIGNHYNNYHILLPYELQDKISYTSIHDDLINKDLYTIKQDGKDKTIFNIVTVFDKETASKLDETYEYLKSYQNKMYFVKIKDKDLYKEYNLNQELKNNFIVGWRK
ncbi:hypothetical protein PV797_13905 [Clostridiaceae bacterium M8S5]|nr:hypothetical protein PV797_13905 [Clostridiaceae bacterium M8S5]